MAFEVQLAGNPGDNGELTDALSTFMNLYESGDDRELIEEFSRDLPVAAIAAYIVFLKSMYDNGVSDAGIQWASPSGQGSTSNLTHEQIGNAIVICEEIISKRAAPTAKQTATQIVVGAVHDAVVELNKHVPPSKEAQGIEFGYEIGFNTETQRFEITHERY